MSTTAPSTATSSGCAASSAPSTTNSARSKCSTASDTALARNEGMEGGGAFGLRWSQRFSLRQRIFAVNIFAVAIFAGSIFYLDGFRARLTQARLAQAQSEVVMIGDTLSAVEPDEREGLLTRLGQDSRTRLRVYGA